MREIRDLRVVDLTRPVRAGVFSDLGWGLLGLPVLVTVVIALANGQIGTALGILGIGFAIGVAVLLASEALGAGRRADPHAQRLDGLQRLVMQKLDTPANREARERWERVRRDASRHPDEQAGWQGVRAGTWAAGVLLLPLGGPAAFFGPMGALRDLAKTRALQHGARGALELLTLDGRAPVLYLRSFGDDRLTLPFGGPRLELVIVDTLALAGPIVAIGEPGEILPRAGAARDYPSEWKRDVTDLMHRASLIVVVAGTSRGLVWEMETLRRTGLLGRVLFVLPPLERRFVEPFWREFAEHASVFLALPAVTHVDPGKALVFFVTGDDHLMVIDSAHRNEDAYRQALMIAAASTLG